MQQPRHIDQEAVRAILEHAYKDTAEELAICASLLRWCEAWQGKKLTKRNCPEGYRISKRYGMTHLEHEAYWRARFQQGDQHAPGSSIAPLIAHSETNVVVPAPDELSRELGVEYRGRQQAARDAILRDERPISVANALNALTDAFALVAAALPWDFPDRHAILEAAGHDVAVRG